MTTPNTHALDALVTDLRGLPVIDVKGERMVWADSVEACINATLAPPSAQGGA